MSLRAKLITLILILILPTVGMMVIFYTRMIADYQEQAVVFQSGFVKIVADDLKNIITDARVSLYETSRNEGLASSSANCKKYLDTVKNEIHIFNSLVVSDREGNVTCYSQGVEPPENISYLPVFKATLNAGDFVITDIYNNSPEIVPELLMGYPVREESGKIRGVLIGFFDVDAFFPVWKNLNLTDNIQVNVLNRNGFVINKPVSNNWSSSDLPVEVSDKVRAWTKSMDDRGVEITGRDKVERIFRLAPLDSGGNYFVSVGFPEGKLIANAESFIAGNLAVISLMTLAVLIITYSGLESLLVKPLQVISQTAENLARGDFSARTNLPRQKDEIGQLGQIFDRMANSLEESRLVLAEETLSKLAYQDKFFRMFEDSILGIFHIDTAANLVEANSALARMFNYPSEDEMIRLVNGSVGSLFGNMADFEKILLMIKQRLPVQMECQFRKSDGSTFDGNLHMWGVWNMTGELEAMEGFMEDITAAKKNRSQLTKLSQAVEQNPIGIIITDGKGNIEYANPGLQKIFGYEPGELIGKSLKGMAPENLEEEINVMRQMLLRNEMYQGEIKNTKRNGEPFWERFVLSPIFDPEGKSINSLCLVEDVTEQNRNKERIIQQVEELSALRTIDLAISSNLDLKATLNIIANLAIKHLGVDAVSIQLYDAQFYMLHPIVQYGLQQTLPENIPFPAAADLSDWDLVEEFSLHIPENLPQEKANHRIPIPGDAQFSACFSLPLVAKAEVKGLFQVFLKNAYKPEQYWLDFFYNLATQTAVAMDNFELFRNLKKSNADLLQAYEATIEGWSKALNYRDQETEDHSKRTTRWTIELARAMGYPTEELVHIRRGALLHDIGKVAVPDSILNKPGPLTEQEWVQMRKHPLAAHEVLSPIQFLSKSLDIPYCHHEHWDGTGYPRGLKGQEIPLAARIFSVIDVYDALTSDRPYRSAWPEEKVIQYLREQSGTQFDPAIVEAFLSLLDKQKIS